MNSFLKKACAAFAAQCRDRGLYIALIMTVSQVIGLLRGFFYKIVYFRTIQATLFSLQANSRIEIFNKRARVRIGPYVYMRRNVSIRVDDDGELRLGEKVFINDNCTINCVRRIRIGKQTKIAPNVCINDHDHNYKGIAGDHLVRGEVIIGDHVWIGANVVILRDTRIGDHAVIAAGSVVKGDVPAHTLFLNKRDNQLIPYAQPERIAKSGNLAL